MKFIMVYKCSMCDEFYYGTSYEMEEVDDLDFWGKYLVGQRHIGSRIPNEIPHWCTSSQCGIGKLVGMKEAKHSL